MSEWIRKINWKYVVVMLIGNIILGLGIAIFKLSGLGNDPFSGMVMALAECVGIEYARFLILLNLGFFVIEIIWGRKLIGLGTIINALDVYKRQGSGRWNANRCHLCNSRGCKSFHSRFPWNYIRRTSGKLCSCTG